MSIGTAIIIAVAFLCLTITGLYAVENWKQVRIREIELALKSIEHQEWKARQKLN